MSELPTGTRVILIGREYPMPPVGSTGRIIRGIWLGDYEVEFDGHPCPVPPGEWEIPKRWVVPIQESDRTMKKEEEYACQ